MPLTAMLRCAGARHFELAAGRCTTLYSKQARTPHYLPDSPPARIPACRSVRACTCQAFDRSAKCKRTIIAACTGRALHAGVRMHVCKA
mmetsp:Transcript_78783/g.244562  ORF Transcript_78783/g.244562 Transcript_78783/m.244562 type:complete len:89 (-) Transcript_78783:136-402(-)